MLEYESEFSTKHKKILFLILILSYSYVFSQDCSSMDNSINVNFSYSNTIENIEMPFNEDWGIVFENQKAILVYLQEQSGNAIVGIVKNKNGYRIDSAHDINEELISQLVEKMTGSLDDIILTNVRLKNIPVKQVEYNSTVYNLGDKHLMGGLMYMIINDGYTYVFMLHCKKNLKKCYIPFFENVMKNTYFGQEWY